MLSLSDSHCAMRIFNTVSHPHHVQTTTVCGEISWLDGTHFSGRGFVSAGVIVSARYVPVDVFIVVNAS